MLHSRFLRRVSGSLALGAAGCLCAAAPALAATFAGATVPKQSDTASSGAVNVKVNCPKGTAKGCTGKLALTSTTKVNGKTEALGSAKFSIRPGKSGKVKVKLTSDGRALISPGQVTALATASSRDGSGHKAKHSTKITLKKAPVYGGY